MRLQKDTLMQTKINGQNQSTDVQDALVQS